MAEAEAYQWEDGSPGVRYSREKVAPVTRAHTSTHTHTHTLGGLHQWSTTQPSTAIFRLSALHRKGTNTTISETSLVQINKKIRYH